MTKSILNPTATPQSYGARLRDLAQADPDKVCYTLLDQEGQYHDYTYRDLDQASDRAAAHLRDQYDVVDGDLIAIAHVAGLEHAAATYGAWKLGAGIVPLNPKVPAWEIERLVQVARPKLVVGDVETPDDMPRLAIAELAAAARADTVVDPIEPQTPERGIVFCSGGSTGVPKLINGFGNGATVPGASLGALGKELGMRPPQEVLVSSPMYHGLGCGILFFNVHDGSHVTVLERFRTDLFLKAVEDQRVAHATVVPTMMQRLLKDPRIDEADLSSLEVLLHAGSVCPDWVKRAWIERIGGERVIEYYAATEQHGFTVIDGNEWLEHPGSVGKPFVSDVKIVGADGHEMPVGEIGEIYMKKHGFDGPTYEYINRERGPVTDDGFASVGDLGWIDEDGYLFIADRRNDLIISGGANIFPAEIEGAISEIPGVRDVVVVGLPSEDWGRTVHAIVELDAGASVAAGEIVEHCKARLMPYKVPKTVEFLDSLPRNDAGKIRRVQVQEDAETRVGGRDG